MKCLVKVKLDTYLNNSCLVGVPQLPYSYYFNTCILVLKFLNKGVFFEEIQDSHFPRKIKRRYFGTHLLKFREQGVNFDVQCFIVKRGGSFGLKSQCFTTKRGFILDWKISVLSRKRGRFELKSVFCHKKGGHFQTGEQGWVPLFPMSEGAGRSATY